MGLGISKYFSLFNHNFLLNTTNFGKGNFKFVMPNRLIKKGEEVIIFIKVLQNIMKEKNIY